MCLGNFFEKLIYCGYVLSLFNKKYSDNVKAVNRNTKPQIFFLFSMLFTYLLSLFNKKHHYTTKETIVVQPKTIIVQRKTFSFNERLSLYNKRLLLFNNRFLSFKEKYSWVIKMWVFSLLFKEKLELTNSTFGPMCQINVLKKKISKLFF